MALLHFQSLSRGSVKTRKRLYCANVTMPAAACAFILWKPASASGARCFVKKAIEIRGIEQVRDFDFPQPLTALVGEALNESIHLVVVTAAGKIQKFPDEKLVPFSPLPNKY